MTVLLSTLGLPDHARPLARLVSDYDPTLSLERLPERHPWLLANPDRPYAVIHRSLQFGEYVVESYPESMLDARLFATIVDGDARRHGFDMDKFDALGRAQMLLEARRREDELETANDKMAFTLKKRKYE